MIYRSISPIIRRLVSAGILLASPAAMDPANAMPQDMPGLDDASLAKAIAEARAKTPPSVCDELLPLLVEKAKRDKASDGSSASDADHAVVWCAIEEKRYADALANILQSERRLGPQPRFDAISIRLALMTDNLDEALRRVQNLAETNGGQRLLTIEPSVIYDVSRSMAQAKRAELRLALWSALYLSAAFDDLDQDLRAGSAINLLDGKADSGLLSINDSDLVDLITNSSAYISLLAEKKFSVLWPYMEERAGDSLVNVLKEDVELNLTRLNSNVKRTKGLYDYLYSLLLAGETQELLRLGAPLQAADFDFNDADEMLGWAADTMSIALRAEERGDESVALLERLASLDHTEKPWIVNFVINHAFALADIGRHAEALQSLERAERIAQVAGSAYARAIIKGQRACSLAWLGRTTEAAMALESFASVRSDALADSIEFAMCTKRNDLAAEWALEGLKNDSAKRGVVLALQSPTMNVRPIPKTDPTPHMLLESNEALAIAFMEVARPVPDRFAPLGGQRKFGSDPN